MDESGNSEGPPEPAEARPGGSRRKVLSLRIALGLVVLVALALGAWANRARSLRDGIAMIRQHGGTYHYDFEYGDDAFAPKPESWAPRWLRAWVGDESLHDVTYVRIVSYTFNDDDLARLTRCFPRVKCLGIVGTSITDRGLAHLRGNTHLRALFVDGNDVSDAGMDALDPATLPSMSLLAVRSTGVSGARVEAIVSLLKARELTAKRANPGKRIDAHFVMAGGQFRKVKARARGEESKLLESKAGPSQ